MNTELAFNRLFIPS